ncbi:MAG: vanadium-dependent haloperoxidase [Flavisolibacter sp.]
MIIGLVIYSFISKLSVMLFPIRMRQIQKMYAVTLISCMVITSCQKSAHELPVTDVNAGLRAKTNASSGHLNANIITAWYKLDIGMMLLANPATNNALNAESFSYMGIGLYESVRSGIKGSVSLSQSLYLMPNMPEKDNNGYDMQVSANAVLANLTRRFFTWLTPANISSVDSLEQANNRDLSLSMESAKFKRSQEYGRAVAAAIYNWAKTDNYNVSNVGYVPPTSPVGVWIPTPPTFGNPVLPFISNSRPLLVQFGNGVTPPLPFPYSEDPASDFYKMVRDVYDLSKVLTHEDSVVALYWNDVGIGVGYTPGGHIMNVITQAIDQNHIDLGTAAQAYAKAGIAIRDAQLVLFRSKYLYNVMRPVSYIRKLWQPNWLPVIPTPLHPEYPSAHAFITSATMRAASSVLGDISVVDHSYDFRGIGPRSYSTLDKVGDEAGFSRRLAGIHYMPSIVTGLAEGRKVGDRVGSIRLTE